MFTLQKLLPFSKYILIQATHIEPAQANKFHICLKIEVQFQTSKFFKPRPPSFLGKQTSLQATLALAESLSFPFHKNRLNLWLISLIIFFGRVKIPDQNTWRLYRTEDNNWSLPAKEMFFEVHEPIHPGILSIKALQLEVDNFEEIKGTPNYLIGKWPSFICNLSSKETFKLEETPEQKKELLAGLAFKPDNC